MRTKGSIFLYIPKLGEHAEVTAEAEDSPFYVKVKKKLKVWI